MSNASFPPPNLNIDHSPLSARLAVNMALHSFSGHVDAAAVGLGVVLAAVSLRVSLLSRKRKAASHGEPKVYQDKDGVASEESVKAYSVRRQNVVLVLFTVLGVSVGLIEAVLVTIRYPAATSTSWAAFILWVTSFLSVQRCLS
jgi:hypothetical protein